MRNLNQVIAAMAIVLIFGMMVISCTNTGNSPGQIDLAENEQQKEEAFRQILNDRELFNDFMDEMMQSQQSLGWMMDHRGMMEHIYSEDQIRYMMDRHRGMRDHLMQNMFGVMDEDSSFYHRMEGWMGRHPMGRGHMH